MASLSIDKSIKSKLLFDSYFFLLFPTMFFETLQALHYSFVIFTNYLGLVRAAFNPGTMHTHKHIYSHLRKVIKKLGNLNEAHVNAGRTWKLHTEFQAQGQTRDLGSVRQQCYPLYHGMKCLLWEYVHPWESCVLQNFRIMSV